MAPADAALREAGGRDGDSGFRLSSILGSIAICSGRRAKGGDTCCSLLAS